MFGCCVDSGGCNKQVMIANRTFYEVEEVTSVFEGGLRQTMSEMEAMLISETLPENLPEVRTNQKHYTFERAPLDVNRNTLPSKKQAVFAEISVPTTSNRTFTVELVKAEGKSLGLALDLRDLEVLLITNVRPRSLAEAWNKVAPPQLEIRAADRIVKVNGAEGSSSDLTDMLKSNQKYVLTLMRPREFQVTIDKSSKNLGLNLDARGEWADLIVKSISDDGSASDWSAANPAQALAVSQRIVAVNQLPLGTSGVELLNCIKAANAVKMTILSYA